MSVHFAHSCLHRTWSQARFVRLMIGVLGLLVGWSEMMLSPSPVYGETGSDSIHFGRSLNEHMPGVCTEGPSTSRVATMGSNPYTSQYLILALHCRLHNDSPTAPTGLVSVTTGSQVTLSWFPSIPQGKVKYYEVWRTVNNLAELLGNSPTTNFVDVPPGNPESFQYQVRAVGQDDQPTAYSNVVTPSSSTFPLTVTMSGDGLGSVVSTPTGVSCQSGTCVTEFSSGTPVQLIATPKSGHVFVGWSGGGCSGTSPCTVILSEARTINASFKSSATQLVLLSVKKNGDGRGSFISNPLGQSCGETCLSNNKTYVHGTTITFTAKPGLDSVFDGWSGGGCSGIGTCTVILSQVTSVIATFKLSANPLVLLSVKKNGDGRGSFISNPLGQSCGEICPSNNKTYVRGTTVTFTAKPAVGSIFEGWSGDCTGTDSCEVTMDTTKTVTATFMVASNLRTVVLQDGLEGYAGTRDTYVYAFPGHDTVNFGTRDYLHANFLQAGSGRQFTMLTKFSVFESEGGPIPDGTPIVSARVAVYKASAYNYRYGAHRVLVPWDETEATWNSALTGRTWSEGGGLGRGTDIAVTPDGEGGVGWSPGWVEIDVTSGVQAIGNGQPNYGWHFVGIVGNGNLKTFHSREYQVDPSLRPKLIVVTADP